MLEAYELLLYLLNARLVLVLLLLELLAKMCFRGSHLLSESLIVLLACQHIPFIFFLDLFRFLSGLLARIKFLLGVCQLLL